MTLSTIETEVKELKEGIVNKKDKLPDIWVDLITFMYWKHQFGDDWVAIFERLAHGHPIKELYYGRLVWKEVYFQDVLSCEKGNWFSERFNIALDFCFDYWIEEGFSHRDLANPEVARECFQVIDSVLNDAESWESFYKGKREEAELWENRHKYRSQYEQGIIEDEGLNWISENDRDWLNMKQNIDHQQILRDKQITAQAVKQVLREQEETPEERADRLLTMAEEKGLLPVVDAVQIFEQHKTRQQEIEEWLNQKKNGHTQPVLESKTVKIHYIGNLPEGSTEIRIASGKLAPVFRNVVYTVDAQVWRNLQQPNSTYRQGDWEEVNNVRRTS